MFLLILGLAIFILVHLFPVFQSRRTALISRLGELTYKAGFAVIALLGFVLIVMGKADAAFVEIWQPSQMFAIVTKLLMLPAMILMVAAYVPSNFKRKIRHPMLMSVKIWAVVHLLANGDLASIVLFGSFLAYAVIAMISINRRGEWVRPDEKPLALDILVIVSGGVAYAVIGLYHLQLFGVAIV